ncbi:hypothetical protein PG994_000886 [Apiospora phragmitis]|uniref:Uncharacterized protein n=1 Tax=Apiospora phragmitis TaxID=2905665 RepID=A0ABR1WRM4_9PEZI
MRALRYHGPGGLHLQHNMREPERLQHQVKLPFLQPRRGQLPLLSRLCRPHGVGRRLSDYICMDTRFAHKLADLIPYEIGEALVEAALGRLTRYGASCG